jgi:protease PrsW
VIYFSLRREGQIVRQFLYPDYQKGFFEPVEYEKLCSIRGRMGLSWNAISTKGYSGWRNRVRCNQLASELAFHRSRVARGFTRDANAALEREEAYLYTLNELRHRLGLAAKPGQG